MEHLYGKVTKMPRIFGGCEEAAKVFTEYKRILQSDEIQKMFTEDMDFKDPNVVAAMGTVSLRASLLTLDSMGYGHLKPKFGPDKIRNITVLVAQAYGDCVKACVVGGTLGSLVNDYRTQVDFLGVYLAEAHARDLWPMGANASRRMLHASLKERVEAARELLEIDAENGGCMTEDVSDTSKMRLVVDPMEDLFSRVFQAHPDRVLFLRDGKLVYAGRTILQQVTDTERLMTHEAREWLEANL